MTPKPTPSPSPKETIQKLTESYYRQAQPLLHLHQMSMQNTNHPQTNEVLRDGLEALTREMDRQLDNIKTLTDQL